MPRFHCHRCQTDFLSLRAGSSPRCPGCGARWPNETSTTTRLADAVVSTMPRVSPSPRFNRPSPDFVRRVVGLRAEQALRTRATTED